MLIVTVTMLISVIALSSCGTKTVSSDSGPIASASSESTDSSGSSGSTNTAGVPSTAPSLWQSAPFAPPIGEAGKLAVVATGPIETSGSSEVAVLIRNNTSKTMHDFKASGTARDAAGTLAGSGSSQGFTPYELKVGEWGFGFVYFGTALPEGSTISVTATGTNGPASDGFIPRVSFRVLEIATSVVRTNYSVTGIVENPSTKDVSSVAVKLLCTGADGTPLSVSTDYADGTAIAGGRVSFSADLYQKAGKCPVLTIGADGYGS
jgi:hypothetical protein